MSGMAKIGKATIETTYDPLLKRYRSQVVRDGEVLYGAVRAKREAAEHAAACYIAYQVSP